MKGQQFLVLAMGTTLAKLAIAQEALGDIGLVKRNGAFQWPGGSSYGGGSYGGSNAGDCKNGSKCGSTCIQAGSGGICCGGSYVCPASSYCLTSGYCCPQGIEASKCGVVNSPPPAESKTEKTTTVYISKTPETEHSTPYATPPDSHTPAVPGTYSNTETYYSSSTPVPGYTTSKTKYPASSNPYASTTTAVYPLASGYTSTTPTVSQFTGKAVPLATQAVGGLAVAVAAVCAFA